MTQNIVKIESDKMARAMITFAIENALLEIGNSALEEVGNRLFAKYHCYFKDCLEHPEYIKDILEQVFGPAHVSVVKSIKENLGEVVEQDQIKEFLVIIGK